MVEMAIVAPMLFFLLFGIIEFGLALNDLSSMRQGVRDAARQGAVLNYGSSDSCGLTGVSGPTSADMRRLMCLTKGQIAVGDEVRVAVKFMNAGLTSESPDFAAGNALVVCAAMPLESKTGMFAPFLDGRHLTAKNVFRIEQDPAVAQTAGGETDPTGSNWSWCTF